MTRARIIDVCMMLIVLSAWVAVVVDNLHRKPVIRPAIAPPDTDRMDPPYEGPTEAPADPDKPATYELPQPPEEHAP